MFQNGNRWANSMQNYSSGFSCGEARIRQIAAEKRTEIEIEALRHSGISATFLRK